MRPLNGCHGSCWKKGPADVDDWSYDNDRWCFLEPCGVLLCCQWHLGLALNACAHVTDLQWKPGGNVGEIIQWHTSHQNFYSIGQQRVTTACEDSAFRPSFFSFLKKQQTEWPAKWILCLSCVWRTHCCRLVLLFLLRSRFERSTQILC